MMSHDDLQLILRDIELTASAQSYNEQGMPKLNNEIMRLVNEIKVKLRVTSNPEVTGIIIDILDIIDARIDFLTFGRAGFADMAYSFQSNMHKSIESLTQRLLDYKLLKTPTEPEGNHKGAPQDDRE